MNNENIVPNSWREKIKNKKVILYNTGVAGILSGTVEHIKKINDVFDEVQKYPDAVLWWRPHPLELSTIESMIPALKELYFLTRERFINENIGILDESSDLNRAIAISDAYYGDWSSVIHLYRVTGKPVLVQSDLIVSDKTSNDHFLNAFDFVIDENKMWILDKFLPFIYLFDLKNGVVEKAIAIPDRFGYGIFSRIVKNGDEIILIPGLSDNILHFDIKTETFSSVNIGKYSIYIKYRTFKQDDSDIYLFPYVHNEIIKYNINKKKIEQKVSFDFDPMIACSTAIINKQLYFVSQNTSDIYRYNSKLSCLKNNVIDKTEYAYLGSAVSWKNKLVIMSGARKSIIIRDAEKNKIISEIPLPEDFSVKISLSSDVFIEKNQSDIIYIFTNDLNYVICVNLKSNLIYRYKNINEKISFTSVKSIDNKIFAFSDSHQALYIINDDDCNKISFKFTDDVISVFKKCNILKNGVGEINRNSFFNNEKIFLLNLSKYLENLIETDKNITPTSSDIKVCGKIIHETMKNSLLSENTIK